MRHIGQPCREPHEVHGRPNQQVEKSGFDESHMSRAAQITDAGALGDRALDFWGTGFGQWEATDAPEKGSAAGGA